MSKAEESLRAAGFYNPHMIASWAGESGLPDVWAQYYAAEVGRNMLRPAAWRVHRPNHDTDPTTHWMNHGAKTFYVHGLEGRAAMKGELLEWASERYGVTEWAAVPGMRGVLFPAVVAKALRAEMRRRLVG